nr:uncharacterized protein LOC106690514 [Halyomorpha halys]
MTWRLMRALRVEQNSRHYNAQRTHQLFDIPEAQGFSINTVTANNFEEEESSGIIFNRPINQSQAGAIPRQHLPPGDPRLSVPKTRGSLGGRRQKSIFTMPHNLSENNP